MRHHRNLRNRLGSALTLVAACAALASLSECKKAEEPPKAVPQAAAPQPQVLFKVMRVDLGNAVGSDKKIAAPSTTFKPSDTIYASIVTEGAASNASLSVRWTFEDGQLVNEASQDIAPTGPAATEFHIAKADGWPAGKYKVDVLANGKLAGSAQFSVVD